jgi:hypothetical protein
VISVPIIGICTVRHRLDVIPVVQGHSVIPNCCVKDRRVSPRPSTIRNVCQIALEVRICAETIWVRTHGWMGLHTEWYGGVWGGRWVGRFVIGKTCHGGIFRGGRDYRRRCCISFVEERVVERRVCQSLEWTTRSYRRSSSWVSKELVTGTYKWTFSFSK